MATVIKGEGTLFNGDGVKSLSVQWERGSIETTDTADVTKTFRPSALTGGWTCSVEYYFSNTTTMPVVDAVDDIVITLSNGTTITGEAFCTSCELSGLEVDSDAVVSAEFQGTGTLPVIDITP